MGGSFEMGNGAGNMYLCMCWGLGLGRLAGGRLGLLRQRLLHLGLIKGKDGGFRLKQCQGRYRDSKACTKHGPKGAFSETKLEDLNARKRLRGAREKVKGK